VFKEKRSSQSAGRIIKHLEA